MEQLILAALATRSSGDPAGITAESEPLRTVNPNEAGQRSDDYGQLLKVS
jgi:hypothetical protein